jgi:hypothetical protein
MLDKDVVIGMKVVPHSKSRGHISFGNCVWNKVKDKQGYLYVVSYEWGLSDKKVDDDGDVDYFSSSDFEPYEEGLKDADIRIGMKVTPFRKTVSGWGNSLDESPTWKNRKIGQNYLYVIAWDKELSCWLLGNSRDSSGDFYNTSDFKLYKEPEPVKEPEKTKVVDVNTMTFFMDGIKVEVKKVVIDNQEVILSIKEIK